MRRLRRPDTPAITGFPRGPGPGLGLADEKGTVGPGVSLEGAEGSPSPFVPVGVGGTSKSAPWGTAGPCLRHSSGSGGTPLLSERRASREPFSGRPRLGLWDPQARPWERRAPTPLSPRERRDPSPVIPKDPFLVSPWEWRALRIRSWGRGYPQTRPWEWRTIGSDPRSRGPPEWLQGPLGAAADRATSLQVRGDARASAPPVAMEDAPLLGSMSSPEDEMVTDLFSAESQFVPENLPLKTPVAVKHEEDDFHVFKDAYLGPADPKEPLLHAFNPALGGDCQSKVKVELLVDENEDEGLLGEYSNLPELNPMEDAVLPAAPQPQAYNVHFLSSLLTPHRSSAVVPLGAWARDGAAHPGVRVIPVRSTWRNSHCSPSPIEREAFRLLPLFFLCQ